MKLSMCPIRISSRGRELTTFGSSLFPSACYEDRLRLDDLPWHWHDEWEAIRVIEGAADIKAGKQRFIITQGSGIFINSGILHSIGNARREISRLHSVIFHPRLIAGGQDTVYWQKYIHPFCENVRLECIYLDQGNAWHKELLDSIEHVWGIHMEEKYGYEFLIREELSHIFYELTTHYPPVPVHASTGALRNGERMKQMLDYIHGHYFEPVTLEQIAASASVSVSEALRCFRSTINRTPIQYLRHFRIHQAENLLETTDLRIVDIGIQCGFSEMSYFAKSFREIHGCTPSEYRKLSCPLPD
ncbi:MAG: AraC family transcriptional regulator [Lachnospiraceae bacterium]